MLELSTILCMCWNFNVTDRHAGDLKHLMRPEAALMMLCGRDGRRACIGVYIYHIWTEIKI